jgi:signal transduction histidine kinase
MKFPSKERIFTWAIPIVLACVLIVLANLQYRWSHEVSDATSTRLRANLQMSLMDFREDLARELTAVCLELQADSEAKAADPKTLSEKLRQWQRTASYSGLVANVYLWKPSDLESPDHKSSSLQSNDLESNDLESNDLESNDRRSNDRRSNDRDASSLLRLLPSEGQFQSIKWPATFDRLHQLLLENILIPTSESAPSGLPQKPLTSSGISGSGSSGHAITPMVGLIDQSIPILIVQAVRPNRHQSAAESRPVWLLIELDENVLRSQVFPGLVRRYYGDPRASDYEVAVVEGSENSPRVLYSSGTDFLNEEQIPADATLNMFGPPSLEGRRSGPADSRTSGFLPAFAREPRLHAMLPQHSEEIFGPIRFDPIYADQADRGWQVITRNRKGSVEAAVEELRRRELGVSFGILVILAATMALIIFTSQRARRLATLQIDFVAGISHELRTPIAAILSAAENIVDGVVESKQQMVRYGGIITNQAKQLNHLVEQVLRFSAARAKTPNYDVRLLNVSDVVHAALENTESVIQSSHVIVECQIEPNLPPVNADFEALSQCLQNLITNAVKYGGHSKWIGIRARAFEREGQSSEVEIAVEDHGIGIAKDEMKQIFDPFYRSPNVAASHIHGTGLGLSLAKSFAEAIGARLTAESEVGKGSAFTVHLPVATQSVSTQSVASQEQREQNALIELSAGPKSN